MSNPDRRALLAGGAAYAALLAGPSGAEAQAGVVTRRSISTMLGTDPILVAYRKAVAAMKALPSTDPRNWRRQAEIHNNFCPHRNWFFLPWHRAYLVAFERLCRQLSGNATFALPYWDWSANPQLPAAFATQTVGGAANPLFDNTRTSQTVTIPTSVAGAGRIATLLSEPNFEIFGSSRPNGQNSTASSWLRQDGIEGPFESGPHDQTHVRINGNMGSFMSPLDPIFWLHHCNIDRLWDRWVRAGGAQPTSTLWRNFAFNGHFVVPNGANGTTPYNVSVSGLRSVDPLGYRYVLPAVALRGLRADVADMMPSPKPVEVSSLAVAAQVTDVPVARINAPVEVTVRLPALQLDALRSVAPPEMPGAPSGPVPSRQRIVALIRDVSPPKSGNAEIRVFLNAPDLKPDTSEQDRHFAGAFTFFGTEHAEHGARFSFLIDLTETVRRLNIAETDFADGLKVQLVAVPFPGVPSENVEVKAGRIEIAVA